MKRVETKYPIMLELDVHGVLVAIIALNAFRERSYQNHLKNPGDSIHSFHTYVAQYHLDNLSKKMAGETPPPLPAFPMFIRSIDEKQDIEKAQGVAIGKYMLTALPIGVVYEITKHLLENAPFYKTEGQGNAD